MFTQLIKEIFKEMFDDNLSWLRDTGLIQKMEADAARDLRPKESPKVTGDRPMTFWKYDESSISFLMQDTCL